MNEEKKILTVADLTTWKITLQGNGRGIVECDGKKLNHVTDVRVIGHVSEVPTVQVTFLAGSVELEAFTAKGFPCPHCLRVGPPVPSDEVKTLACLVCGESLPLQSEVYERGLLGEVLAFNEIPEHVGVTTFNQVRHRIIFMAMLCLLTERHQRVDHLSLAEELKARDQLAAVGGPTYLLLLDAPRKTL